MHIHHYILYCLYLLYMHTFIHFSGESCYSDEYCDGKGEQSNRFLTFLVTAASSVVLFILGYYYIDNKRQDGQLIGQINSLQRDLLFSTKVNVP